MEVNAVVISIFVLAVIAFVYFIVKRNRKDQKSLEKELKQQDVLAEKHDENQKI